MSPGTDLTGFDFFLLIVPVLVALFFWVVWVLWADTHPDVRHTEQQAAGYEHQSYARTDEDAMAGESAMAMSAADEEPVGATAAAGAAAGATRQGAGQPGAQPGQESR